jgi:hypothetical protein
VLIVVEDPPSAMIERLALHIAVASPWTPDASALPSCAHWPAEDIPVMLAKLKGDPAMNKRGHTSRSLAADFIALSIIHSLRRFPIPFWDKL